MKRARRSPKGEDGLTELRVETSTKKHSSSGYGAIAQLGERVLCKHEVVGSIPSGSTRWFDCRGAFSKGGMWPLDNRPRNIVSHVVSYGIRVRDF